MQLKSAILPGCEAFKTNEAGHLEALRVVAHGAAAAAAGGGEAARERHRRAARCPRVNGSRACSIRAARFWKWARRRRTGFTRVPRPVPA